MSKTKEIYDLLGDFMQGSRAVVEELLIGQVWTSVRTDAQNGIGLAMSPPLAARELPWPGSIAGKSVKELAGWLRSWQPFEANVATAAANAVINAEAGDAPAHAPIAHASIPNLAVFEWFYPCLRNKKVAVVGRYPGLERYRAELDITVLEMDPGSNDLPAQACETILPAADWVFLTGTSIPNQTFPRLAELSANATTVLMGPTVPWLPELADFGIDYLAGTRVNDFEGLHRAIGEGAGKAIFEKYVSYHIMDLRVSEMNWLKVAIENTVAKREHLKQEMESWYANRAGKSFPKRVELEEVDRRLSDLDLRFRRVWDARYGRKSSVH